MTLITRIQLGFWTPVKFEHGATRCDDDGETLQIQKDLSVLWRQVVRADAEHAIIEMRSGSAQAIAPEYLVWALATHG